MQIAHGEIGIDLHDEAALAGLKRIEADFERTMNKIDREHAEAHVGANLNKLKKDLAEAEAMLKAFEKQRGDAGLNRSEAALYGIQKKQTEQLRAQVAAIDAQNSAMKRTNQEAAVTDRRIAAITRKEQLRDKVASQAAARRVTEMRQAENAAHREEASRNKAAKAVENQALKVAQLRARYATLTDTLESLDKQHRKTVQGFEARAKVEVKQDKARAEMLALKKELNLIGGHPPVEIQVDVDRRHRALRTMVGLMEKLSSIGHVRLNLGPFSGTLRTMTIALAALAPLILDVVGASGALVGVLGAGIAGAAAVGGAGLVGLLGSFIGLKATLKPIAADYKVATSASTAYNKAVLQYGKDSKQAVAAQEKLQGVLKGMDPVTQQAVKSQGRLRAEWDKLTQKTARKDFGTIMKNGMEAANRLLPSFAKNTNAVMDIGAKSSKGFFGMLAKPGLFNSIFAGFQRALPSVIGGVGSLAQGFLRMSATAAKFLPDFANMFQNVGKKFNDFTKSDNFGSTIARWVGYAKDLMHFFGAAGRVLMHFFGAGAGQGDRFLNTMTAALNRWDEFLTSTSGKDQINTFFSRAVDGTLELSHALGPLIQSFLQWSNALAPITTGFLKGITVISRFIAALTGISGANDALKALGFTLATAFAIGKIAAITNAILRLKDAIIRARTASLAGAGLGGSIRAFTTTLAAPAAGAAAGRGVAAAEGAGAAAVATNATRAAGALTTAREAATGLRLALTAGGLAAGALATFLVAGQIAADKATHGVLRQNTALDNMKSILLGVKRTQADNVQEQRRFANPDFARRTEVAYQRVARTVTQVGLTYANTRQQLADAQRQEKDTRGTDQHAASLLNLRQAVLDNQSALGQWRQASANAQVAAQRNVMAANENLRGWQAMDPIFHRYAWFQQGMSDAMAKVTAAQNIQATTAMNLKRQYSGMLPVLGSAQQKLGALARQGSRGQAIAQKIAVQFEAPKDVGAVAAKASQALKNGVKGNIVTKAIVDSASAEEALRRLNAAIERVHPLKRIKIQVQDAATGIVDTINAAIVALHPRTIKIAAKDAATSVVNGAQAVINAFHGKSVPITVQDHATSTINSVLAGMARVQSKTATVTVYHDEVIRHRVAAAGAIMSHAAGGPTAGVVDRAHGRAASKTPGNTRGGSFASPRYLVGEENRREYVIATNPAYRQRNERYLGMAAGDLGMRIIPAAGGWGGWNSNVGERDVAGPKIPGRPKDPQTSNRLDPRGKKPTKPNQGRGGHYVIPQRVFYGGEDEAPWQTRYTDRQTQVNTIKGNLRDADREMRLNKGKGRRKGESKAAARARHKKFARAKSQHDNWTRKLRPAIDGLSAARKTFNAIHGVNVEIERLQNIVNANRTDMETAANHKPAPLDAMYGTAKKKRGDALAALHAILQKARDVAVEGGAYQAKLDSDLAGVIGEEQDTGQSELEVTPVSSIEDYLNLPENKGMRDELARRQTAFTLAQVDTPANINDDRAAAASIVDWYSNILGGARTNPAYSGNQPLIGSIGEALLGARGTYDQLMQATPDETAQTEQLKTRLATLQTDKDISDAFAKVAGGPGDINDWRYGSARAAAEGRTTAGPTIVQHINTLVPGDPRTYEAVGEAAATGFGFQGSVTSPRLVTGL